MKIKYIRFMAIATILLASTSCANAGGVAQQMQQQTAPQQYQQQQYPYQQQVPQYLPQDNDENYRLPGQYSPTLNELRKEYPQQPIPPQGYQYNKQIYDQNDSGQNHNSYYYQ